MPTVTATFKDISGNPISGVAVIIRPADGISVDASNDVVVPVDLKQVTASDGTISVSLLDGNYELGIEGVTIKATIPDTTETVDLGDTDVITNTGSDGGGAYS